MNADYLAKWGINKPVPRNAADPVIIDCLIGPLTNMDQVVGYISTLELKLKEAEDKLARQKNFSKRLFKIIVDDACDEYESLLSTYGSEDPLVISMEEDLASLYSCLDSKIKQNKTTE